jgi:hypothetical protein
MALMARQPCTAVLTLPLPVTSQNRSEGGSLEAALGNLEDRLC